jgi:hypothetical protein
VARTIRSVEKSSDLTGNRTLDLPACSIVPQLTALPRVPYIDMYLKCRSLVGNGPLGRTRRTLECSIKVGHREVDRVVWTGLIWLRIGTSGGFL